MDPLIISLDILQIHYVMFIIIFKTVYINLLKVTYIILLPFIEKFISCQFKIGYI